MSQVEDLQSAVDKLTAVVTPLSTKVAALIKKIDDLKTHPNANDPFVAKAIADIEADVKALTDISAPVPETDPEPETPLADTLPAA